MPTSRRVSGRALPAHLAAALLALAIAAPVARAGIPYPWSSDFPTTIVLGGSSSGAPDTAVSYTVVVRRLTTPVPGATVELDFSECPPGEFVLCDLQSDPGLVTIVPGQRYMKFADGDGRATFRLTGHSNGATASGATEPCAVLRSDGVFFSRLRVATYDLDGAGGVSVPDLGVFLGDRFRTYRQRSDYNGDGTLGPVDLSRLLHVRFAGGSNRSCGAVAP